MTIFYASAQSDRAPLSVEKNWFVFITFISRDTGPKVGLIFYNNVLYMFLSITSSAF